MYCRMCVAVVVAAVAVVQAVSAVVVVVAVIVDKKISQNAFVAVVIALL